MLPLAITLLLGCVDFARAIHVQIALTNAARVGAEAGATQRYHTEMHDEWESRVRNAVQEEAQSIPDFDPEKLLVDVSITESVDAEPLIVVTVFYDFRTAVHWPVMPHQTVLCQQAAVHSYR